LTRGDVLVEAGGTHVDARLATRWQRVWDALEQEPVASRNET
jgi:flagellar biosynthesis/type III secretory pathway protein FliH